MAYILGMFDIYTLAYILGTNLYEATLRGVNLLKTASNNESNSLEKASMLILLTDGQPTSGISISLSVFLKIFKDFFTIRAPLHYTALT